jgi:replicative superfamily II helicase
MSQTLDDVLDALYDDGSEPVPTQHVPQAAAPVVRGPAMPATGAVVDALVDAEFRPVFRWDRFNGVQTALFNQVFNTDDNLLVVAPTGTGKTVVVDMAIVGTAQRARNAGCLEALPAPFERLGKVVYIAPMVSLCMEKATLWSRVYKPLGLRVVTVGGESSSEILGADILCATPERWDAFTRKWQDHAGFMSHVGLVVLDEVHTIGSDRGAVLEAIVTRMVS